MPSEVALHYELTLSEVCSPLLLGMVLSQSVGGVCASPPKLPVNLCITVVDPMAQALTVDNVG